MLPPLCLHHVGMCYELLCVYCHLLAPVCSGHCILKVVSVFHTFNRTFHRQDTSVLMSAPAVFATVTCFSSACIFLLNELFFCSCFFTALNSLHSFDVSISTFRALCASPLLAHANTCSLVSSSVLLIVVSSHIMSVIILSASSFMLLINYFINLLPFP